MTVDLPSLNAHFAVRQLVVDMEFPRNGKKWALHEVFSDITETSFVQTADIGEKGGPLKRWLTIHATRIAEDSTRTSSAAEGELRALMEERRRANLEGDATKLGSMMTDDYLQTDISGYVQDRATWFKEYFNPLAELIKAEKFRWEVFEQKDLQFRFHGDSAVVVGVLEAKGQGGRLSPQSHTWEADANATFNGALRFTHVYVRRDGKWLLALCTTPCRFHPRKSNAVRDQAPTQTWSTLNQARQALCATGSERSLTLTCNSNRS